jgi:hypothetical protein
VRTGDIELVLDHLTAVPAKANEKTAKYDRYVFKFSQKIYWIIFLSA